MTVKEMHIEFDLALAQLGSNVGDHFSRSKRDWFLNKASLDVMASLMQLDKNRGLGFDDIIYRNDILQNLVSEHTQIVSKYDDQTHYGFLPYNYFTGFKAEVGVDSACVPPTFSYQFVNYDVIQPYFEPFLNLQAASESYVQFKVYADTDVVTGPSDIQTTTIFGSLGNIISGGVNPDIWYFIDLLLRFTGRSDEWEIYTGQYSSFSNQRGLVFRRKQDTRKVVKFAYFYNAIGSPMEKEFVVNEHVLEQPAEIPDSLIYKEFNVVPYELKSRTLENPFARSEKSHSKGVIRDNKIFIHHNGSFVPYTLRTIYIRRPKPMIYSLDLNCEIGMGTDRYDKICSDIVAKAVALASTKIEASNAEVLNIESINLI